jgi:hypothetical protein
MGFADPPDNIGLQYAGFKDKMPDVKYQCFLHNVVQMATAKCNVLWLSLNSRHSPLIGHIIHQWKNDEWDVLHCVQTITFYQHNHKDFGNAHRIMYRLQRKDTARYMDAVRVPSWRQLNGDKRADQRGKVPGDVFEFPRVTGNSHQRRSFSPTQLHEGLYERCIRSCCAPGDTVVDLFAGSGTLGRVAARCKVNSLMIEMSRETCDNILKDQPNTVEIYL